ncbi:MAG: hypothetical protein AB1489_12155 [Acidobacteriota bacterium]
MNLNKPSDEDTTEKVKIIEQVARAIKATIELLVHQQLLTRDELQVTSKMKKKHDLANRVAKLAWIFDSLVSTLEQKSLIGPEDTETIYTLQNLRMNPNRAAGLAVGEFTLALTLLLDCLTNKKFISKQEAMEVLKVE